MIYRTAWAIVVLTFMSVSFISRKGIAVAGCILLLCFGMRPDALPRGASRMAALPRVTLWAWERREDLREANPDKFAVAYLDQALTIDLSVHRQPRLNPVVLPSAVKRIAVVRIETTRFAVLDDVARDETVDAILTSAAEPGIAAVQVDFDAKVSQRKFYRNVLFALRRRLPAELPLSITALASWCSWDNWIRDLPVDEAVPMFFRMEPDRRRATAETSELRVREPLCASSIGVSTTERWPEGMEHKRVYVFPDRGWHDESLTELERRLM